VSLFRSVPTNAKLVLLGAAALTALLLLAPHVSSVQGSGLPAVVKLPHEPKMMPRPSAPLPSNNSTGNGTGNGTGGGSGGGGNGTGNNSTNCDHPDHESENGDDHEHHRDCNETGRGHHHDRGHDSHHCAEGDTVTRPVSNEERPFNSAKAHRP